MATDLTAHMPALRRCLAEWLATCALPPMHFLVMPDTLTTPHERRVLVAQRGDQIVAYLVITPIPQPDDWEPVYVLSAEQQTSLRTLYAIAEAFCGSPPPVFLSYALVRALAQELRWAKDRLRHASLAG